MVRYDSAHLKHAEVLCLARGWAFAVAQAEAEQSQDDRWSVGAALGWWMASVSWWMPLPLVLLGR